MASVILSPRLSVISACLSALPPLLLPCLSSLTAHFFVSYRHSAVCFLPVCLWAAADSCRINPDKQEEEEGLSGALKWRVAGSSSPLLSLSFCICRPHTVHIAQRTTKGSRVANSCPDRRLTLALWCVFVVSWKK